MLPAKDVRDAQWQGAGRTSGEAPRNENDWHAVDRNGVWKSYVSADQRVDDTAKKLHSLVLQAMWLILIQKPFIVSDVLCQNYPEPRPSTTQVDFMFASTVRITWWIEDTSIVLVDVMHRTQRMESCKAAVKKHPLSILLIIQLYIYMHNMYSISYVYLNPPSVKGRLGMYIYIYTSEIQFDQIWLNDAQVLHRRSAVRYLKKKSSDQPSLTCYGQGPKGQTRHTWAALQFRCSVWGAWFIVSCGLGVGQSCLYMFVNIMIRGKDSADSIWYM